MSTFKDNLIKVTYNDDIMGSIPKDEAHKNDFIS